MEYIPVIDLAKITAQNGLENQVDWISTASEIEKALHGIGFMYLINHGVRDEIIRKGFKASSNFFSLDSGIKEKYKKDPSQDSHGWVQPGQELLNPNSVFELRECFDYMNSVNRAEVTEVPDFYATIQEFKAECNILIRKLLKLLGLSLGLDDPDYFLKCSGHLDDPAIPNESDFRAIYYPPVPKDTFIPEGSVRCAEHTDYEIVTLLFQDNVGGLEVKAANGKWVPATPIPGAILVNTGDLLEFWTSGHFPATFHRVIIPKQEIDQRIPRYSFAYFFPPDNSILVTPLKSKTLKEGTKTHPPVTVYDHIMARNKSAYQY